MGWLRRRLRPEHTPSPTPIPEPDRAAGPTDGLYRVLSLAVEELAAHPTALADLHEGPLDALVIKGLFSGTEMRAASQQLDKHRHRGDDLTFGAMVGYPLNKVLESTADYLLSAENFATINAEIFGVDIRRRLDETFDRCSGGRTVGVPLDDGRPYSPGTFRIMSPGLGGLRAHTGNEFVELFGDRGMQWLTANARMTNSMSYFLLVQEPESGGELLLADLLWENTSDDLKGFDENQRDDSFFERGRYQVVPLSAGDMLVFAAGHIWHKVSDVGGTTDRVTFGGFMALSNDDESIWYWG